MEVQIFGTRKCAETRKTQRFFSERRIVAADSNFFEFFDFPLLEGDPQTALDAPNSVVLTQSSARKYFGNEDPIGQTLLINERPLEVTGVFKKIPANSTLDFDFVISFETLRAMGKYETGWSGGAYETFYLLQPGFSHDALIADVEALLRQNAPGRMHEMKTLVDRLPDLHFKALASSRQNQFGGNESYLYIFGGAALLILLLAAVNVVIMWYGGYLSVQGRASIGDIMAFQWYTFLLLGPVWNIVNSFSELQRSLAAMERVFEVLAFEEDKPDRPGALPAPQNLQAASEALTGRNVVLSWSPVPGAVRYRVYRMTAKGVDDILPLPIETAATLLNPIVIVEVLSPTKLECVTPPSTPGVKDVTVTTPDNQSAQARDGFTYSDSTDVLCVAASCPAAPLGPRNTIGTLNCPPDM